MEKTLRTIGRAGLLLAMLLVVPSPASSFTEKQADRAEGIFTLNCSVCHGRRGRGGRVPYGYLAGTRTPPLVGRGTLPVRPRPWQKFRRNHFSTAWAIWEFLTSSHPPRGMMLYLKEHYWDVIAFLLLNRGLSPDNTRLGSENARAVRLPGAP